MCFAEGLDKRTMKLAMLALLLIGGSLLATLLIFAWLPRTNGAVDPTLPDPSTTVHSETFHLGDEIYAYDAPLSSIYHRFFYHGYSMPSGYRTSDRQILIGHFRRIGYGSGIGAGMSNIYLPIGATKFTLIDRTFTIEEIGADFITLSWEE